jgi:hypothetical protein
METTGNNKWVWVALAVVIVLFFLMRSSGGGSTSAPAGMDANTAATEQTRLSSAASAYGAYLQAQTAQLISNNNVTMNGQTVAGNVAQSATNGQTYRGVAATNANSLTTAQLIAVLGGLAGSVLKGLVPSSAPSGGYGGGIPSSPTGYGGGPIYAGGGGYTGGYG